MIACITPAAYLALGGPADGARSASAVQAVYQPLCSYDSDTSSVSVDMTVNPDTTLSRSGDSILANGAPCGLATVYNTDTIVVTGDDNPQWPTIDLSGGPLAPGATPEGSGQSEIEIQGDLAGGLYDALKVIGSSGDDNFRAGTLGVNLNGDDDADITLTGVEGLRIEGRDGNDTISAAGGLGTGDPRPAGGYPTFPILVGGPGDDVLTGGAGDSDISGDEGDDLFVEQAATSPNEYLYGGSGIDTVSYAARTSGVVVTTSDGLPENDGAPGENDFVHGDVENVYGGSGNDTLTGGAGPNALVGGAGADSLYGGGGSDALQGDAGNDQMYGGAGIDTFDEGSSANGADIMIGGAGPDTVSYAGRTNSVSVSPQDGLAQDGESGEGDLVRVDVENVTGGSGNDTIVGTTGDNELCGGAGNDTISAGGGADWLEGGSGSDTLNGGPDDDYFDEGFTSPSATGADTISGGSGTADTVSYINRSNPVWVTLADGLANDGEAGEHDLVRADVEDVSGGLGNDTVVGSPGVNFLYGNGGSDALYGGGGNDYLNGGLDNDVLYGGAGNDSLSGMEGDDMLTGGTGQDWIYGDDGADALYAVDGEADRVDGGADAYVDTANYDVGVDVVVNIP